MKHCDSAVNISGITLNGTLLRIMTYTTTNFARICEVRLAENMFYNIMR